MSQLADQPRRVVGDPRRLGRIGREDGDLWFVGAINSGPPIAWSCIGLDGLDRTRGGNLPPKSASLLGPPAAKVLDEVRPAQDACDFLGDGSHVMGVDEEPRVSHEFRLRRVIARDHGRPAVHRFEQRQAQAFIQGGERKHLAATIEQTQNFVGNFPREHQRLGDPAILGIRSDASRIFRRQEAGDNQLMLPANVVAQQAIGVDQPPQVFPRVGARHAEDERPVDPELGEEKSLGFRQGLQGRREKRRIARALDIGHPASWDSEKAEQIGSRGLGDREQAVVASQPLEIAVKFRRGGRVGQMPFLEEERQEVIYHRRQGQSIQRPGRGRIIQADLEWAEDHQVIEMVGVRPREAIHCLFRRCGFGHHSRGGVRGDRETIEGEFRVEVEQEFRFRRVCDHRREQTGGVAPDPSAAAVGRL